MAEPISIERLTGLVEHPAVESHPPMLFLHGYFADASVYAPWLAFFAERGHRALALNFRGRGGSQPGTVLGRVSVHDYADDALVAARWLGRPIVVGHSMGGLVAQMIAARDAVRAAVLVAPAPPRGITVLSPALAVAQLRYLPAILSSRVVRPGRADLRRLVMNRVPVHMQDEVIDHLVPDSGRAGREMSIVGVPVDASRIRVPVFVIGGDDDRFVPLGRVRQVARRYRAPLLVVEGHGHMLLLEPGWEEVADRIEQWITREGDDPTVATRGTAAG